MQYAAINQRHSRFGGIEVRKTSSCSRDPIQESGRRRLLDRKPLTRFIGLTIFVCVLFIVIVPGLL